MQTFLTPEPITIEIRNSAGEIRIDLADVTTTTVDVVATSAHPFGFLDDVIRAARTQFGDRRAFAGGKGFGGPSFDAEADSTLDDPTELVRVDLREGVDGAAAATLIVDTDPARDGWKSSFTVHVTAPTASGIRVQSQSADVTVTGSAEKLETRTASGDVRVGDVVGRTVVQTASGDVAVTSTGECDLRTASGDIEVENASGEAVVHSTSGDIRLAAVGGNINARSVSGDIRVLDVATGRAEVVTVSGDVEIGIHAGTLTAVDLSTVSGSTDTDFQISDDAPPEDDGPTLDLRVKTTSGNIRLRRSVTVY